MTDGWADPQSLAQPTPSPQSGGGGPSPLAPNPYLDKADSLYQDAEKQFGQQEAAEAPYRAKLEKILASPNAAQAHLQKVEDAPKPEDYRKNSMEWAGAMAVLGALAGRFTRNAGNASLNAFAGAVKGWKEGNLEAYTSAAKEWEQNTKKTLENNQMEIDKYKQILENKKLNIDQMMAAMNVAAAENHDKIMFDMTMAKNYTGVANAYEKRVSNQAKLQSATDKNLDTKQQHLDSVKEQVDYLNANPGAIAQMPPDKYLALKGAAGSLGLKLNDPAEGQAPTRGTQPRSAPAMETAAFREQYKRDHDGREPTSEEYTQNAAKYAGTVAGSRTANQYAVRVDQAAGEAEQFAQNALSASERFPRNQFVPANKAIQAWQSNTSNPDLAEFGFYNFSLANAYARAVNPTGVPRIDTANKFLEHLSTAQSPEVYRRLVGAALTEIKGAQTSVRKSKEDAISGGQQSVNAPATGAAPKASGTTSSGVQWSVQP